MENILIFFGGYFTALLIVTFLDFIENENNGEKDCNNDGNAV